MSGKKVGQYQYSPVMVCGASAVAWNHKPGEPTVFDRLASVLKRTNDAERNVAADHGAVPAHGIAG